MGLWLSKNGEFFMHQLLGPIISIIAGILVLIYPKLLNYVVAVYLIVFGIVELFAKFQ